MYREITGLLFHPGDFFTQKQHEEIRFLNPAVIVAIGGIVTFLSPLLEVAFTRGGDISNFAYGALCRRLVPRSPVCSLVCNRRNTLVLAGSFPGPDHFVQPCRTADTAISRKRCFPLSSLSMVLPQRMEFRHAAFDNPAGC